MKIKKLIVFGIMGALIAPITVGATSVQKSNQHLIINDKLIDAEAYTLNDNNYFKLRDIIKGLSDTGEITDIIYDQNTGEVEIVDGKEYSGGESNKNTDKQSLRVVEANQKVKYNGNYSNLTGLNINDNNYVKLRDISQLLNKKVLFDMNTQTIFFGNKLTKESGKLARSLMNKRKENKPIEKINNKDESTQINSSSNDNILTETKTVNGIKMNVVTVPNNPAFKYNVVKANNVIIGSEPFESMVSRSNSIVAVNGNYFDAYKTLIPYGSIIINGEIIQGSGYNAAFIQTKDGKNYINKVTVNHLFTTEKSKINAWYTNADLGDPTGIYVFNKYYGNSVKLPSGKYIIVEDDTIKQYENANKIVNIPKNGHLVYLAQKSIDFNYLDKLIKVGDKVNHTIQYKGDDRIADNSVKILVAAGPLLVKNGKNVSVSDKSSYEGKIRTQNAQRSAIGIKSNGDVIIVTGTATVDRLANAMISLGCIEAINLDGGASSALYANGKVLQPAGRKLNTVLSISK